MWEVFDELEDIGVAKVDSSMRVVRCNRVFAELFNDDPIHVQGRSVLDLTSPVDRERTIQNFEALFSGKTKSIRHEKRYTHRGRSVNRMLHCIYMTDGNLMSFVYVSPCRDDTGAESRRVEELEALLAKVLLVLEKQASNGIIVNNQTTTATGDRGANVSVNQSESVGGNKAGGDMTKDDKTPWLSGVAAVLLAVAAIVTALEGLGVTDWIKSKDPAQQPVESRKGP